MRFAFREATVRSSVRRIRFHDLRYAWIRLLLLAGEELAVISKVLGHSDDSTTLQVCTPTLIRSEPKWRPGGSMRPLVGRSPSPRMWPLGANRVQKRVQALRATSAGGLSTHEFGDDVSEAVCKPSSVLTRLRRTRDGHPSGAAGRPTAHAADPRAGQRTSPPPTVARLRVAPSYLALLRVEFARFTPIEGLRGRSASSLWHWSSPHGGRALPATLRCGARTFLTPPDGSPRRRRAAIRPPR